MGRSSLKPRYALGYGQGAYGYDTRKKVEEAVNRYWMAGFPLDTMHIDVDIQDNYRTFTVDEKKFPRPRQMFSDLRANTIKCCTNITPFINSEPCKSYSTLKDMMDEEYHAPDERYLEGTTVGFQDQRYLCYENGQVVISDPIVDRPGYNDDYVFWGFFQPWRF